MVASLLLKWVRIPQANRPHAVAGLGQPWGFSTGLGAKPKYIGDPASIGNQQVREALNQEVFTKKARLDADEQRVVNDMDLTSKQREVDPVLSACSDDSQRLIRLDGDCSGIATELANADSKTFKKLFGCRRPHWLAWGLLADSNAGQTCDGKIRRQGQSSKPHAPLEISPKQTRWEWLKGDCLTNLSATYNLPKWAKRWSAAERLEFENDLGADLRTMASATESSMPSSPAAKLIRNVEIPLVLATAIRRHKLSRRLANMAFDHWNRWIADELSEQGWLSPNAMADLALCVAAIARIHRLLKGWRFQLADELRFRVEHLMLNVMRMWRPNGNVLLNGGWLKRAPLLVKTLASITTVSRERRLIRWIGSPGKSKRFPPNKKLPETGTFCEEKKMGVLRANWSRHAAAIAVDGSKNHCRVDIAAKDLWIAGNALPEVTVKGQALSFLGMVPELNLFHADKDVEYLELEWRLGCGVVWQRQFLVVRRDELVLLADAVLSPAAPGIKYACRFPLAQGVTIRTENETREVHLVHGKRMASVLPIGMGEWKSDGFPGSISQENGNLVVQHETPGAALWVPLVIDLNPKRSRKPKTWRRLTVGENMRRVPSDQAIAARFQLNRDQFVAYRSLNGLRNRTYLGVNLCSEFALGRADGAGQIEQLLMIE